MLKLKYRIPLILLVLSFALSAFFSIQANAADVKIDPNASVSRINRMTLKMGGVYLYDSNTTDDDWTFHAVGTDCPAEIKMKHNDGGDSAGNDYWELSYQVKNQGGSCGANNTKILSMPTNWSDHQYVVLVGGSSDGKFISVMPTNHTVFKKGGTYNGDTVYIQQGVDAYSCPLVVVHNSSSDVLIPLEKKNNEDDVSNQIKELFNRELGVPDTACGPTDNDDLGIFKQFGLPESYYDAGHEKDHYEHTDFGFDGQSVASATIYTLSIADGAGISAEGPLAGGGYTGEDGAGGGDATDDPSSGSDATQCNIPKTGWIICPVLDTMANIGDQAFSFLSDNFLSVDAELFNTKDSGGKDSGTYTAWKAFRDIANIAFVIAVMVVVYSQLTGAGISNYGIKKLLPKIVVAAILVNLSYFICQLAVDISNILGSTLRGFFTNVAIKLPGGDISSATTSTTTTSPLEWVGIVGVIIVAGTVAWLALGALIPILIAAIIAMFMILFILLARKALIILLIALAPLAFVAYLLPNTEQWYKRWQKTFVQLLMVYPIIAVVFGASTLASSIVAGSASGDPDDNNIMIKIIAAGIAVIPLFVVPGLLKKSIDAAGNIGAKINGIGNKVGGFAGKKGSERFERSAIGRGRNLRRQAKQQYRDRRFAERLNSGGVTKTLAGGIAGALPGRFQTRGVKYQQDAMNRSAFGAATKADREDIAFAEQQLSAAAYQHPQGTEAYLKNELDSAIKSGDKVKARAAFSALSKQGEGGVEAARAAIAGNNDFLNSDAGTDVRQSLQQHISENHSDLKGKDSRITNWAGNTEAGADGSDKRGSSIQDVSYGGLTDAQIAGQTKASLSHARATGHLSDDDVNRILTNPDVSSELKRDKREVLGRSSGEQMDVIHDEANRMNP